MAGGSTEAPYGARCNRDNKWPVGHRYTDTALMAARQTDGQRDPGGAMPSDSLDGGETLE
ncbi:hypothetical protein FRC03_011453 [Tulasnella sp. 419]|nr:hypothetical protein FRC02_005183 [Tulasnella sp. 418]KAG8966705.1 hypothetical protein FRC03_011453 [Tulasnella sp. 419]